MKKILPFLLILLWAVLSSCASASATIVSPAYTATASGTPLSFLLLDSESLNGNWKIDNKYLDQKHDLLSQDNSSSEDFASVFFVGHVQHNGENFSFTFYHNIRYYTGSIPEEPSPFTGDGYLFEFPIRLNEVGKKTLFKCTSQSLNFPDAAFLCEIIVNYEHIQSFLRVTGEARYGSENAETLLNQILLSIDEKIK